MDRCIMCGIVGVFCKNASLEPRLGDLLSSMLVQMSDRGPDSAGVALYGAPQDGAVKLTLRGKSAAHMAGAAERLKQVTHSDIVLHDTHAVARIDESVAEGAGALIAGAGLDVDLVGTGRRMELYKEVGLPGSIVERFGLRAIAGSHGIGHTRMATESAVTTDGAHPFSTGLDQCLVHNGSLSNHNRVRRSLRREGIRIDTENDTEVAAGYLTWRMRQGMSLGESLTKALDDLDGFYTFVVGTETGFGVLRDPISCKPAVMAETDDYVAFASEYRALTPLPGIEQARLFEPEPARVYFWER